MTALGWLWLVSPFVLIALISRHHRLQGLVAEHYARCRAAGLVGAGMMLLGAAIAPAVPGMVLFALGTPLTGLMAFLLSDGGGGGGGGGNGPDVPPVDWDDFERSFRAYARASRRPPRRPLQPTR